MTTPTPESQTRLGILYHLHQQYPGWVRESALHQLLNLRLIAADDVYQELGALCEEGLVVRLTDVTSCRLTSAGLDVAAGQAATRQQRYPITITALSPCCPADGRALRLEAGRWSCSLCRHSEYAYQPPRQARLPGPLGADRGRGVR